MFKQIRDNYVKRINTIDTEVAKIRKEVAPLIHYKMQRHGVKDYKAKIAEGSSKVKALKDEREILIKNLKRLNLTIANKNRTDNGGELL